MQAQLPKPYVALIRGSYLLRTSYATVGTLYGRVSYLREVVIERASEIEKILIARVWLPGKFFDLRYPRGSHREFIEDAFQGSR